MTEEDKDSTWGRLRDKDYFIVHEGDMLFYQREDGSQEYGIANYFYKNSGLTWETATPQEIAIAKAYLLLEET